jgi:hypothetical protein
MSEHDCSGLARSGRELAGTGFEHDLGAVDPVLLAALDDPQDETALMAAVAQARLLVPIVAAPGVVQGSGVQCPGEPMPQRSADLAVVTLTLSDGRRGLPVFSSLAALHAWDPRARPSPVASTRAAQAAVTERCDVMLLDLGSEHELLMRPSMVWALAQQRGWLPAHADPFVARALVRATAKEEAVTNCAVEADPAGAGILRVVLSLRAGLDATQVGALATRVGERIATDGEARARIDGLAFTIGRA